jgi:hypothetical protein
VLATRPEPTLSQFWIANRKFKGDGKYRYMLRRPFEAF